MSNFFTSAIWVQLKGCFQRLTNHWLGARVFSMHWAETSFLLYPGQGEGGFHGKGSDSAWRLLFKEPVISAHSWPSVLCSQVLKTRRMIIGTSSSLWCPSRVYSCLGQPSWLYTLNIAQVTMSPFWEYSYVLCVEGLWSCFLVRGSLCSKSCQIICSQLFKSWFFPLPPFCPRHIPVR